MRAVILAAGEGLRLRPLTLRKPKVMIPVANRPILEYGVEALVESGIKDITIVVGYHRERVQSHFEDGVRFGARIRYAFQEELRGTAHAFAQAKVRGEDVLVLAGDNIIDARFVRDLVEGRGDVTVALQTSDAPSKYGVVRLEGDRIVHLEEKPREVQSDLVSTGYYRLSARALGAVARQVRSGRNDFPQILRAFIERGPSVHGIVTRGLWLDAVHPWDLLRMNFEALRGLKGRRRRGARTTVRPSAVIADEAIVGTGSLIEHQAFIGPGTTIGNNVTVGAGAVVENSILMDDVQVEAGSIVRHSIVADGTRLAARFLVLAGPCRVETEEGPVEVSTFGCVIGEDAQVGGNVVLEPGVTVGAGARVASNLVVRRPVRDGAMVR